MKSADLSDALAGAHIGVRRSLELAHEGLLARGLAVGAVILDVDDAILGEGRNRVYDPSGGAARLQRTPVAHAEMNALAVVDSDIPLGPATLWSSHRPCSMCAAACAFVGVGTVRFVAPDPSDERGLGDPAPVDHLWAVAAMLLFLAGVERAGGPTEMTRRAVGAEPEVGELLRSGVPELWQPSLSEALSPLWPGLCDAADRRGDRLA